METAKRINEVLEALSDYGSINIDKFYNDKNNDELFKTLESFGNCKFLTKEEDEMINDLYDNLDHFIKFETEYNSDIGDF